LCAAIRFCRRYAGRRCFSRAFLASLGAETSEVAFAPLIDETLDDLARHIERHVDLQRILALAAPVAT
jgi:adenosylcobyric acid synthase